MKRKYRFDEGAFCFHKTDLKGNFPLVVSEKNLNDNTVTVSWMNQAGNLKVSVLPVNTLRPAKM